MDEKKKPTREEIVRSLRCCREDVNIPKCRAECVFFPGVVPAACAPALCGAAADLIEELTDRCARYAEEIMELKEQLRKYRLAEGLAAAQNESGPCPFAPWCDAVQAAKK